MSTIYTDLSHHDWNRAKGELDFDQIRSATSGAICLRATYGDPRGQHYPSPHFRDMTRAAKASGFTLLGAYHNLVKGDQDSINRQVDWLRSEMDSVGSNWAMLDIERYDELVASGNWPRWDDVQQFAARWIKVEPGRVLAFYLPEWIWAGHLGRPDLRKLPGPLVSSKYGSNPTQYGPRALYTAQGGDTSGLWKPYGGRTPEILQYGSKANCPGASGDTDCNAYRGTFKQLTELLTRQPPKPAQPATPAEGNSMDQGEKLVEKTGYDKRTVGDHFADIQNVRDWLVGKPGSTSVNMPGPDSRIGQLYADVAAIRAGVAQLLTSTGEELDLSGVVSGVVAGLAQQLNSAQFATALADAIPDELAADVVDEIARRFAAGQSPDPDPSPDA